MSAAAEELTRDAPARGLTAGDVLRWALVVLAVFLLAWISKTFTRDATRLSTIWLANGLLLGVLLYARPSHWFPLIFGGFVANLASGLAVGDDMLVALTAGIANPVEVAIAAYPLRRYIADPTDLGRMRSFGFFLVFAVLLAPLASGVALLGMGVLIGFQTTVGSLRTWFIAHALGIATMAPTVFALVSGRIWHWLRPAQLLETTGMFALLIGVAVMTFAQTTYPLLFVIFPPLLLIAMRTDLAATAVALLMVTLIGVWFTVRDSGPLSLAPHATAVEHLLLLQLFIAVVLLSLLPIVVSLTERRREQREAGILHARYQLLANHVSDVVMLTDRDTRRLYVSPAVYDVFGYTPDEFLKLSFRNMVHPEDLAYVTETIFPKNDDWNRLTLTYRGFHRDGRTLWIEAQISRFRDVDLGELAAQSTEDMNSALRTSGEGRVVTLRDITRRREAEQAVELASRELENLVRKDGLTGLANRRSFDEDVAAEWSRCQREKRPLSVVILDVDHFKVYNDRYGHQLGDRCLIAVSDAIASGLYRPSDLAARYGGEEFAVVLPGAGLEAAVKVANRIRQNVVSHGIEHSGSNHGIVTVSVGVATVLPHGGATPDDLLRAADEALYASKHAGRNRVTSTELL